MLQQGMILLIALVSLNKISIKPTPFPRPSVKENSEENSLLHRYTFWQNRLVKLHGSKKASFVSVHRFPKKGNLLADERWHSVDSRARNRQFSIGSADRVDPFWRRIFALISHNMLCILHVCVMICILRALHREAVAYHDIGSSCTCYLAKPSSASHWSLENL